MRTKIYTEKKSVLFVILAVFLIMTLLSFLTPMVADDYNYCYSFADGRRISSVGAIIESMIAHRNAVNGRIVAHSLVQLFLMLPKAVFNVANGLAAAVFVFLISLFSDAGSDKKNILVMLFSVLSLWYFVPQFGEVFLWLDGAFNYGWAMLFSLLFVLPFYLEFTGNRLKIQGWVKIVYAVLAFAAGAYSESISLAMLFTALCLFAGVRVQGAKTPRFLTAALAAAFLGYIFMMLSPSELSGRTGEFSVSAVARNFEYIIQQTLTCLGGLYCVFMLILGVSIEAELTKPKSKRDIAGCT